jgi:hypothetical protein
MFVLAAVLGQARQQNAEFAEEAGLVLVGVSVMGAVSRCAPPGWRREVTLNANLVRSSGRGSSGAVVFPADQAGDEGDLACRVRGRPAS